MALIKCPECGREVSDKAVSCPRCGFPMDGFVSEQPSVASETQSVEVLAEETPVCYVKVRIGNNANNNQIIDQLSFISGSASGIDGGNLISTSDAFNKNIADEYLLRLREYHYDAFLDTAEPNFSAPPRKWVSTSIPSSRPTSSYSYRPQRYYDDDDQKADIKSYAIKVFSVVAVIIVIGSIIISTSNSSPKKSASSTYSVSTSYHTNAEAFTIAEEIVEGYLKSPSTAKFCKITEATISHAGNEYTVKGYVDAQNSFGATLRQYFTVTYTATAKGYKNGSATFS